MLKLATTDEIQLTEDLKKVDFHEVNGYVRGQALTWGHEHKTGQIIVFDGRGQPWKPASFKNPGDKEIRYLLSRHLLKKLQSKVRLVRERDLLASDLNNDSRFKMSSDARNMAYAAGWQVKEGLLRVWDQNGRSWTRPLRQGIGHWLWPGRLAKQDSVISNHNLKQV